MSVTSFTAMTVKEYLDSLPAELASRPSESERESQAATLGVKPADLVWTPVHIVPECHEAFMYQQWLCKQPAWLCKDLMPVLISCASTYDTTYGANATKKFMLSMKLLGRPHDVGYMAYLKGAKTPPTAVASESEHVPAQVVTQVTSHGPP